MTKPASLKTKPAPLKRAEKDLRAFALSYPGAYEDYPWGERVAKVAKKVFAFFHVPSDRLNLTVKLPQSATLALGLPFTSPTGYGLGKSGWVTASFERGERPPVEILRQWIDESYRAVAPRKLVAGLSPPGVPPARKPAPKASRARRARGVAARRR